MADEGRNVLVRAIRWIINGINETRHDPAQMRAIETIRISGCLLLILILVLTIVFNRANQAAHKRELMNRHNIEQHTNPNR